MSTAGEPLRLPGSTWEILVPAEKMVGMHEGDSIKHVHGNMMSLAAWLDCRGIPLRREDQDPQLCPTCPCWTQVVEGRLIARSLA